MTETTEIYGEADAQHFEEEAKARDALQERAVIALEKIADTLAQFAQVEEGS
jgi:hypothetical protein